MPASDDCEYCDRCGDCITCNDECWCVIQRRIEEEDKQPHGYIDHPASSDR